MLQINLTFNFGDHHYKFINLTNDTMHCEKIHTIKKKNIGHTSVYHRALKRHWYFFILRRIFLDCYDQP